MIFQLHSNINWIYCNLIKWSLKDLGFLGGSDGKESSFNVGDLGLISGLGRFPGEGNGSPLQYSGLENPHGQGSLAGHSSWGGKESNMIEHSTAQS